MNYRHGFHAGNFADVHKHAILTLLLRAMGRKEKPFLYLETHAGGGRYDLHSADAERSREWEEGISRLWAALAHKPSPLLAPYLAAVAALNPNGQLRHYPGSPLIARACLRPTDRIVLLEARFSEAQRLEEMLHNTHHQDQAHAQVRIGDGYAALPPWLPPPERRGVVFMDPPFERNDEFKQLLTALTTAHRCFATGTVAIWYPLKDVPLVARFHRALQETGLRRLLLAELRILPDDVGGRLHGGAVLLHNPPWQLDQAITALHQELAPLLAPGPGCGAELRWLVGE